MPQDHPDGTIPMQITGADKKLPTDWQDQYRGVFLKPDWEAKEGRDKTFETALMDQGFNNSSSVSYTVPAGKTLYITDYTFYARATNVADADSPQMCLGHLRNVTDNLSYMLQGGNGGGGGTPVVPIVIPENKEFRATIYVYGNHNMNAGILTRGYEV